MAADPKRMPIEVFQREGYLQEANRQFFHPLGLALTATSSDDPVYRLALRKGDVAALREIVKAGFDAEIVGEAEARALLDRIDEARPETMWLDGVWDHQDDPEGVVFGDESGVRRERAADVREVQDVAHAHRLAALGFVVEPVGVEVE